MLLKISEVAEMLNISIHTIRYYEKLGMIQVNRQNSIRVFTEQDVKLLRAILEWKELGFTLEQVKTIAALEKNGLGCKDVQLNELKEGGRTCLPFSKDTLTVSLRMDLPINL